MKDARKHSSRSAPARVVDKDAPEAAARAFAIPVLHAVLISLALLITLVLYVGMWREKILRQNSELTVLAKQNSELTRNIEASRKHAAELRSAPAAKTDEERKTKEKSLGGSKP